MDLSKSIEEVIHHQSSKTEVEDKVQQEIIVEKYEYRLGQPIMFREAKKGLKKKGSKLWVIKKLKIGGTIELGDPCSRQTKVVTRKL